VSTQPTSDLGPDPSQLVLRPTQAYLRLPLRYRWEATRRHPYYLCWWRVAAGAVPAQADNSSRREFAQLILSSALQVGDVWPDPATSYDSLGNSPGMQPSEGGALAPLTRRTHLSQLIRDLDGESFARLIFLLIPLTLPITEGGRENQYELIRAIVGMDLPELDEVPDRCLFSFNPHAPLQALIKDFSALVRQVKRANGITESRRRDEKLRAYFEVWDAREGWDGAAYDRSSELSLKQVAARLKRPLKTVSNQYRSAFRVVTGHPYTPDLWLRVMASWKWLQHAPAVLTRVGRPLNPRRTREAPATRVVDRVEHAEFLRGAGVTPEDLANQSLLTDIRDLIAAGDADATIYRSLDLSDLARECGLVEHLRRNLAEL
jgi:hypothetical protein